MALVRIQNATLNPEIWEPNMRLKDDVHEALLKLGYDFYKQTQLAADIEDMYFLGSMANYNWSPTSDIDLHVLINFAQLSMPEEYARMFTKAISGRWNMEHEITVKGFKVEVYLQDVAEENKSTGVYSLIHDNWVTPPVKEHVEIDPALVQQKFDTWKRKIMDAIEQENLPNMKATFELLVKDRDVGLHGPGGSEFSVENIVFKLLRNRGYIKKLKDTMNNFYDKKMSLKEYSTETKSKYFSIPRSGIRPSGDAGKIMLGDEWFANFNKYPDDPNDYGELAGKWLLNRHTGAHQRKMEEPEPFDSLAELMEYLDDWYENTQLEEGYGAGKPEDDRLHIKGKRWQIKSKDAPKTPNMPNEGFDAQSMGPNPEATVGDSNPDHYQDLITQMRDKKDDDQVWDKLQFGPIFKRSMTEAIEYCYPELGIVINEEVPRSFFC